jgi:hypothetical protein
MNITADIDTTKTFDISAALARPEGRVISRLMAMANIEPPKGKLAVADLDRQLAGSKLTTLQKLELKVSLDRIGALAS